MNFNMVSTEVEGVADDDGGGEAWEWIPVDDDYDVHIPDSERLPLPPSTVLQGRHLNWRNALHLIRQDNLQGRLP